MADDFISGFLAGQGDGNSNRGGMFGGDGWWAIIIFALIFGWGRGDGRVCSHDGFCEP